MKKLGSIVAGVMTLAILTSCASEEIQMPVLEQPNQVQTQSNKGLSNFYKLLTESYFKAIDKNKDGAITLDEYKGRPNLGPGVGSIPSMAEQASMVSTEAASSPDDLFKKIDRNKNGKVSLSEANYNAKLFLGANKTQIRSMLAKPMFEKADANKSKTITREEFVGTFLGGSVTPYNQSLYAAYLSSDTNKNGSLSLFEFEDLVYASFEASLSIPPAQPTDPAQPSDPAQPDPSQPADPAQPPSEPPADQPAPPADPAQPAEPPSEQPAPPAEQPAQP